MMKILIIAEHDQTQIKPATYHVITAAAKLGTEIDLLIIGSGCEQVAKQALLLPHIKNIFVADHEVYAHQLAENSAALIAEIGKNYAYILTAASTFGKNILPRVAALLDVSMLSDVTQVVSADTFVRPIYAGNVMTTVQTSERIKVMTIRTTAFAAVKQDAPATAAIHAVSNAIPNTLSKFEGQSLTQSKRPELTSARVIISGGRGLKSAENFQLLESIADKLGAAIGASRAAVDAGFAPNDYQVGQTGKVVAPDLYIAVGISGAIQHLAGMKDSKVIVAINNDPEAPIFQVADYGLVGDLFKILPEIQSELEKMV
ncbi:MAG: hypothetical protein ACD_46C00327G0006 [uncultured bacterium]|nr:MAG: hypothetical protein ACD_46C00327G0006 [uncultured bacterium]